MEWKKCSDGLPEQHSLKKYLFWSDTEEDCTVGRICNGVIQSYTEDLYHNNITHWAGPIEPPKGE